MVFEPYVFRQVTRQISCGPCHEFHLRRQAGIISAVSPNELGISSQHRTTAWQIPRVIACWTDAKETWWFIKYHQISINKHCSDVYPVHIVVVVFWKYEFIEYLLTIELIGDLCNHVDDRSRSLQAGSHWKPTWILSVGFHRNRSLQLTLSWLWYDQHSHLK